MTRKNILILSVIVGVVVIGLVVFSFRSAIITWLGQSSTGTSLDLKVKPAVGTLNDAQAEEVTQATTAATAIYNESGDVDNALAAYDSYAKASTDGVVVATILFSKGLLLLNTERYSDALAVAQSIEASAPTHTTAMLIAEASAQLGDKAKAIEYYKIAIERAKAALITPPSNAEAAAQAAQKQDNGPVTVVVTSDNTIAGYEQRLAELQQ